ncbi:MAG: LysM peptidoglycan-binding domain-containing protein [Anaerolineae bacterium]|nr:LysM peptidoglycan-binding domain-containing protein [Anaerolineae bacterium]
MNRRALIVFVLLNIVISVGVALLVIYLWQGMQTDPMDEVVQVFEVVITATPGPTQTPWVVTVVGEPDGAEEAPLTGFDEPTVAPTLNQEILPAIATSAALTQVAVQSSGSTERTYTVEAGDNPSLIAEANEVSLADLLCANDLGTVDEPEFIFAGQVLIIPGSDFVCDVAPPVVETEEPAEGPAAAAAGATAVTFATAAPTVTLAPTAENAQVVVVEVIGAGDVTREGVVLRNQGGLVALRGWTLYDTEGNIYAFPDYRLFPDAGVTVFTRVGEDTPVALFWGETRAAWQPDDVVSLADASGVVQSTFRVGQ